jgi:hypothetical protein
VEVFILAERLFMAETGNAPGFLTLTVQQAISALRKNSKGEALNEIRKADKYVQENNLEEWKAEMHAMWAIFHHHMKEEKDMLRAIRDAQRLEPNNARIEALRQELLKEK